MAQYCTNQQLNILNNNRGHNENLVNNVDLSIVSMPIAHYFSVDALQIIKEQANIPRNWSRARIADALAAHLRQVREDAKAFNHTRCSFNDGARYIDQRLY